MDRVNVLHTTIEMPTKILDGRLRLMAFLMRPKQPWEISWPFPPPRPFYAEIAKKGRKHG